jgi:hypothetical protein
MTTRALLLLWIGCSTACTETDEEKQADDQTASRCRVLCDEDDCGAETSACLDECVVQARGLDALCVQCLVEESDLYVGRRIDDDMVCDWDPNYGWSICDEDTLQCSADDNGECDDAASTCELSFGDLADCGEFCR